MKTDPAADSTASSVSRRGFVVVAGAAVVPAASTSGSTGSASSGAATGEGGSDDGDDEGVTVEATRPYLPTVRAMVEAFEERSGAEQIGVHPTAAGPVERVHRGPADVHVCGRPAPSLDGAVSSDFDRVHAVHGWAVLAPRRDEWFSSLRSNVLPDRVGSATPVETWRESDWQTVTALQERADQDDRTACLGLTNTGENRTAEERTAIVHGTRAFQYAHGHGGVAYYEIPTPAVGSPSAARERGDGFVPLVRLGHVRADASPGSATAEFLAFYRARASTDVIDDGADGSERERVTSTA